MSEPADLAWVTGEQQFQLSQLTDDWQTWLLGQLDEYWPEWRTAGEDDLVAYVTEMLSVAGAAATDAGSGGDSGDAADFGWVGPEQQEHLDYLAAMRGDWREWLPDELDAAWPEWRQSDGDTLGTWLTSLLPTLGGAAGDASDLSWVTPEQIARLESADGERGNWRDWLPAALDAFGEWRQSAPETLVPWLDSVLPYLVMPAAPPEAASPDAAAAVAEELRDTVIVHRSGPEGRFEVSQLADLSPDELDELINRTLADAS